MQLSNKRIDPITEHRGIGKLVVSAHTCNDVTLLSGNHFWQEVPDGPEVGHHIHVERPVNLG